MYKRNPRCQAPRVERRLSPEERQALLERQRRNDQAINQYLSQPDRVRNSLPNM